MDFTKEEQVQRLADALRQLLKAPAAPVLDIQWLRLRCEDTLGFYEDLRRASAVQLHKDVADFEQRFPNLLPAM
ncbi:hypothetical protein [Pyxidicoccus caerfyrddinensis]|uniref:hypothetical protein n=1 Tax=Pyxidicoccus caerfyrddinensis TaxID=2709663 RepID=UPI0013D9C1AF|nr:hypothetical protein [Pyxidicoccus caerfyrddinensis]